MANKISGVFLADVNSSRKRIEDRRGSYVRLRERLLRPIASPRFARFLGPALRNFFRRLYRALLRFYPPDLRLRQEFNGWAKKHIGERMELDHTWFVERTIPEMKLSSGDRILDLGCGDGWACRLIGKRLGSRGRIVGLDVSDEMVRRARMKSSDSENLAFVCGSADRIPCRDEVFTKVVSIEAFYYFARQPKVLAELFRVVAPEGQLFLLICLYKERPDWRSSRDQLRLPVHVRSTYEYKSMLLRAGWREVYTQELRHHKSARHTPGHGRALLITARRSSLGMADWSRRASKVAQK